MSDMKITAITPWLGGKRDGTNDIRATEVLLINGPSYTAGAAT